MRLGQAVRAVDPGCFAFVMATGIVSAALRLAGQAAAAGWLLALAAGGFAVLAAASCWRAVTFPAGLRADLAGPGRGFTWYAFVAACGVLVSGLAAGRHRLPAAALAVAALAGWLVLAFLIPAGLRRARPAITEVSGTWYLCTVGTQSVAVAVTSLAAAGALRAAPAERLAILLWSAGVVSYLTVTALVLARLARAGPGPADLTAPYWVAMGAASISVLAAGQILHLVTTGPARAVISGAAVALWSVATALIPALAALSTSRWRRLPPRPGQAWVVVFPAGMYTAASLTLGASAKVPLIHRAGEAALWPALAAWGLTATAALAALPRLARHTQGADGHEAIQVPGPGQDAARTGR
jgi:tellurite resistance protein TehA-like permease